jgi:hypothetical protein
MSKHYRPLLLAAAVLLVVPAVALVTEAVRSGYPEPPQRDNSLFYIQRSKNTNAIVYEANTRLDGTLDEAAPVSIYWIRYTTDSTTAPLTYIQDKFAYGVKALPYPNRPGQYILTVNSYHKRQLYLLKKPDNLHYGAFTMIGGRFAELKRVFIQLNGGTFWFPNVEFIELAGVDAATHKPVVEQFVPKQ